MTKYIFVTGGVVSSIGKGVTASSLGRLLKKLGLSRQKTRPLDPETDPVAAATFKKHPPHCAINP